MARSNSQVVLPVTGSGQSIAEVLDGLVRDVAARSGWTGGDGGSQLVTQLEQLRLTSQAQADAVAQNTQAILQNTIAHATAGGASGGGIGSVFSKVIGSGLGLAPLVSGLAKLFGGGNSEPVTVLTPYTKPVSISFEGSISASGADEARKYQPVAGGQQITIQVQAMDSRSFIDHSEDIARAVREAMLNSHALNDVVNDL
ncbi:MAG TPA: hypothetical protein PLA43_18850 [Bryobacteraceae bacterium]|nr:hypothetical protein [Bryobacteraceae bacterium]HOL70053.1 hypothetical protein [Bryobacteraceae bacterium]HOQ46199.1 hypothetical protein [Bryobacteraceae bacterium]HPU74018.1 hypothetical protein [Bryobacteraceae bacterium]